VECRHAHMTREVERQSRTGSNAIVDMEWAAEAQKPAKTIGRVRST
jgi:hypothetical protein